MTLSSWAWTVLATVCALGVGYFAYPGIGHFFTSFYAPFATVRRVESQIHIPLLRGASWLFLAYLSTALLFAFTGGVFGCVFAEFIAPRAAGDLAVIGNSGMNWGFVVGIIFAGLSRTCGVSGSKAIAHQLATLAVGTISLFTFFTVVNRSLLTTISDIYLKASSPNFPFPALIATAAAAGSLELLLLAWNSTWGPHARQVPQSGVRELLEDFQFVEQILLPNRVVRRTNELIHESISNNGLRSLLWLTSTAPESHVDAIHKATLAWAGRQYRDSGLDPHELTARLIGANVRVIVPSPEVRERLQQRLPSLKRFRVLARGDMPGWRMRVLVVNGEVGITHLPVPYYGTKGEEANYAAIARDCALVHELENVFDNVWESIYFQHFQKQILDVAGEGGLMAFDVLAVVCRVGGGTTAREIARALIGPDTRVSSESVDVALRLLKECDLVWEDHDGCFFPTRRRFLCGIRDTLARLRREGVVDVWPRV